MKPEATTNDNAFSADQVLKFLRDNPNFFSQHPEILESLYLPHQSGSAVSLVEKQLTVLREKNTELRTRLGQLMELSKTNDGLFKKSRTLVVKLIAAETSEEILEALEYSFKTDFGVEFFTLKILENPEQITGDNGNNVDQSLAGILSSNDAVCGVIRHQQLLALFGARARQIGSVVALRLAVKNKAYGVLALGNSDSHYYHSNIDTLFLRFLVDILNEVLYPKLRKL